MATQIQKNQIATTLIDGWTPADATWTYASASTITVPSGAASIYQKGDRIKWTQTTVKYGVIVAVADTLLTIAVNTDYTVANAAISANYFSHQANPLGYPTWFSFTPTETSGSGLSGGTRVGKFKIDGSSATAIVLVVGRTQTGTTGTIGYTLPFTSIAGAGTWSSCRLYVGATGGIRLATVDSSSAVLYPLVANGDAPVAWTNNSFYFESQITCVI